MNSADVLLVDDEAAIRSLLSDYLSVRGYTATCAESGEDAYRLIEARAESGRPHFTAVVSDWMMPGMDGLALLEKIRSGDQHRLPFVLMSGAVSRDVLLAAVKYDPDAVLLKPFSIDLLCAKIAEAAKARERKVLDRVLTGDGRRSALPPEDAAPTPHA